MTGQLPEAMDPETAPKTWMADLQMMMRHGRMEPALPDTLATIRELAKRGRQIRITQDHEYSVFSTSRGILAFRRRRHEEGENAKDVGYDSILIGIHGSKHEPPPWPFPVESRIGGIALLTRKTKDIPAVTPLSVQAETYFGKKCTVYEYGPGHWISRLFVRNERVIAISFGLEW